MAMSNSSIKKIFSNRPQLLILVLIAAVIALVVWRIQIKPGDEQALTKVIYGISPYQDTVIPQYAKLMEWYLEQGLDVDTKILAWGDVMPAVGGKAVDIALQNFNSFQATYWNLRERGIDPVFYYVMYVFKGAAIIIPEESALKTVSDFEAEGKTRKEAVKEAAKQLRGKKIAVTEGTEMEQVVIAALKAVDLDPQNDATLVHAQPDEALAAFLNSAVDAFSAGVTEHTEAARHGARILLSASDILPPVLDGIVTTREYVEKNRNILEKLIDSWFRTIQYLEEDFSNRTPKLIEYLSNVASTKYSVQEYEYVWGNLHFFAGSRDEVKKEILDSTGKYYWRRSWDANNEFLLNEGKIPRPVPYEAFWAGTRSE